MQDLIPFLCPNDLFHQRLSIRLFRQVIEAEEKPMSAFMAQSHVPRCFIQVLLIQWKMPGRAFIANVLLFTMIFNGGMIPTYLVMKDFHLTNNLWGVILLPAINVYNLVLMKNFFEGIPVSLMESAEIDGCSHFRILYKIVLPLSKAALASIGLMYAVGYWNDYTNYKLYITNSNLYNFQMKLRALIMGSDLPSAVEGATENTVKNAAVIVAILPFMIIYPFCQKYFVQGVNIGAVKE